jgi:ATP-binding cassette subfamily C exporter for protease/lipase
LDEAGEQALLKTILNLKERQCTTIIISHRSIMLGVADKILMLRDGQVAKFGPRDEVLNALRHPSGAQIEQLPKSVGSSHPK